MGGVIGRLEGSSGGGADGKWMGNWEGDGKKVDLGGTKGKIEKTEEEGRLGRDSKGRGDNGEREGLPSPPPL